MTLLFIGLCVVFGFFAFRHFSNGRFVWGAFAALGCLLMAGAVWVDFQRASDAVAESRPAPAASPAKSQPAIGDYTPPAPGST